jgi:hypothetical protein
VSVRQLERVMMHVRLLAIDLTEYRRLVRHRGGGAVQLPEGNDATMC